MHPIKQALLEYSRITGQADAALAEWEKIEKAAKALVANHVADVMVDRVAHSDEVVSAMTDSRSQWFHPRVTEVGQACEVLMTITTEAP